MRPFQSFTPLFGGGFYPDPARSAADDAGARRGPSPPALPCRTLVGLRWLSIAGQTVVTAFVAGWLDARVPVTFVGPAIAIAALFNIAVMLSHRRSPMLSEGEAATHLAFDMLQLATVLYLTGGICNPFSALMLVPVTIAASVLGRRAMLAFVLFALVLLLAISIDPWPLPWPDPEPFMLPDTYVAGIWLALSSAIVVVAFYANSATEAGRRRIAALDAAAAALQRARQLADLGALAAAAAHELGTPLGTITLTLKDLLDDTPADAPHRPDLELMLREVERCRHALERLRQRDFGAGAHPFDRQPVEAILREVARPFEERSDLELAIDARPGPDAGNLPAPRLQRRPELLHALSSFVENAVGFARTRVDLEARWSPAGLEITIADDGPGFPDDVLGRLGEPYVSTRRRVAGDELPAGETGLGLGLGVFIACSLLERTGARVRFANRPQGGAVVTIAWPADAAILKV